MGGGRIGPQRKISCCYVRMTRSRFSAYKNLHIRGVIHPLAIRPIIIGIRSRDSTESAIEKRPVNIC